MDLKIRLGNKLLNEIKLQLEGYGLTECEHKAHELMHIIAHNTTPKNGGDE